MVHESHKNASHAFGTSLSPQPPPSPTYLYSTLQPEQAPLELLALAAVGNSFRPALYNFVACFWAHHTHTHTHAQTHTHSHSSTTSRNFYA